MVEGIFKMIDKLDSKVVLRPETRTKLKKVREELDEELKKEATAEKKEEVDTLTAFAAWTCVDRSTFLRRKTTRQLLSVKPLRRNSPS